MCYQPLALAFALLPLPLLFTCARHSCIAIEVSVHVAAEIVFGKCFPRFETEKGCAYQILAVLLACVCIP
jgi:hypothetical protein